MSSVYLFCNTEMRLQSFTAARLEKATVATTTFASREKVVIRVGQQVAGQAAAAYKVRHFKNP
jgi:hypothetical protein